MQQRRLGRLHHIVAARAVDVHVEQGRDKRGFGQLDVSPLGQRRMRLRENVADDAIFDDDNGPLNDVIGRERRVALSTVRTDQSIASAAVSAGRRH